MCLSVVSCVGLVFSCMCLVLSSLFGVVVLFVRAVACIFVDLSCVFCVFLINTHTCLS